MLQFFFDDVEYTTRARLQDKFGIAHTNLQKLLEDHPELDKVVDGNKFYFEKTQVEQLIQEYMNKK